MLRDADGFLDKGATVTCADALVDLIDGRDFTNRPSHPYRYRCALEAVWNCLGEYLGQLWVDDIDEFEDALAGAGVPLNVGELVSGHEVVPLPACNAEPFVGSWPHEQLVAAVPAFARSGLEALPWDEAGVYEELDERLALLRHFVEQAADRPGWGLVALTYAG
jgi:hypothetical protein